MRTGLNTVHLETGRTGLWWNHHVVVNWSRKLVSTYRLVEPDIVNWSLVRMSCQVTEQESTVNYHVIVKTRLNWTLSVYLQTGRTGHYHMVVNWSLTLVPVSCQVIEQDNTVNYIVYHVDLNYIKKSNDLHLLSINRYSVGRSKKKKKILPMDWQNWSPWKLVSTSYRIDKTGTML